MNMNELTKTEQKLKESEEKYRTLFEGANDAIFLMNNYKFIECNEKTLEIFGCKTEKEILELRPWDFSPPNQPDKRNSKQKAINYIEKALNGKPQRFYWKHIRKDKTPFDAEVSLNRILLDKKYFIQAIVRDISDRMRAEKKIIESEKKFRVLFNNSTSGIAYHKFIYDVSGNPINYEITDVNPKYEKILSFKKEEVINKRATDIYQISSAPYLEIFSKVAATQESISFEAYFPPMDKNFNISAISARKGEFITVFDDISERKNAEHKLKDQSEELSALNRIIKLGNESMSLQEFLEKSYDQVLDIVGFDRGGVYLYDVETQHNILVIHKNVHADFIAAVEDVDISEGLFKKIFDRHKPFYIEDFSEFMEGSKKLGIFSAAIIPLRSKDEYMGSLNVGSPDYQILTQNELDLLMAIGKQMGIIIQKFESEKLLKESEEKYKALFNDSPFSILLLSKNGDIVDLNPARIKKFGGSRKELIGKNFRELRLFPTKYFPILNQAFESVLKGNTIEPVLIQSYNKEGKLIYVQLQGSLVRLGNDIIIQVISQDINERVEAEKKLKESEEKYKALFYGAPLSINLLDEEGKFVENNAFFGYTKDDLRGKDFRELNLYPDEYSPTLTNYFNNLLEDKPYDPIEFQLYNKERDLLWVNLISNTIKLGDQRLFHFIIQDITERKNTEQTIKESEEKFRTMSEESMLGIAIIQDNVIKYINQRAADIFGYKTDELKSWEAGKFENLIHLDDRKKVSEQSRKKKLGHKDAKIHNPFRGIKKSGEIIYIDNYANNITFNGQSANLSFFIDVTEHMKAEERLKESEEKYRRVVDNVLDVIIVCDIDGTFIFVSPQSFNILGYKPEEIVGIKNLEFVHPDDLLKLSSVMKETTTTGDIAIIEHRFRHKKGHYIHVYVKGQVLKTDKDYRFFGVIRDISERKQAEEKMKESEEKFRTISEQSLMGITIIQDNVIKYVNQRMADLFGYSIDEVLNWKPGEFTQLFAPDALEFVLEQAKKKQLGDPDQIVQYPIQCVKKSGELFWVENYSKSIMYEGRPADLITEIDITERIKSEQELKESEEKFRHLFYESPLAILIFNLEGNLIESNLKIAQQIFDNLDIEETEFTGKSFIEIFSIFQNSEQVIKLFMERYRALRKGKTLKPAEFYVITKDGREIWLYSQSSQIKMNNKTFIQVIIQNITEKKEAERLIIEENKKLIELKEMREDLITRINHELKTPLTTIYGVTQVLLENHKEDLGENLYPYIEISYRGAIRLKELIDNLLDVSRLDSKKIILRKEPENLVNIIKDCVMDMTHMAKARELTLNVNLPKELLFEVDKLRIEQVIINLISNAIKNTPRGGDILVSLDETMEFIDIKVIDNGVGLTKKEKEILFQKFGKIERYGKDLDVDIEGPGLGLYISKEFVDLHDGKIIVESEGRSRGATFTVRLFK